MTWNWHVHFLSRKLELLQMDWDSYYSSSKEAVSICSNRGFDLQAASFLLLRAQNALELYKFDIIETTLNQVNDILTIAARTDMSSAIQKSSYHLVKRLFYIIEIMFFISMGKMDQALPVLTALHALLDDDQSFADQDELTMMNDTLDKSLNIAPSIDSIELSLIWKQKKLPYLLSYLLSGLVHKYQDTSKAILFLNEGLKAISGMRFD